MGKSGKKLIVHTGHGHSDVTSDNAVTARNAFGCPRFDGLEYPIAQRVVAGLGGVPHSDLGFLDGKPVPGSGGELDMVHWVGAQEVHCPPRALLFQGLTATTAIVNGSNLSVYCISWRKKIRALLKIFDTKVWQINVKNPISSNL